MLNLVSDMGIKPYLREKVIDVDTFKYRLELVIPDTHKPIRSIKAIPVEGRSLETDGFEHITNEDWEGDFRHDEGYKIELIIEEGETWGDFGELPAGEDWELQASKNQYVCSIALGEIPLKRKVRSQRMLYVHLSPNPNEVGEGSVNVVNALDDPRGDGEDQ